MKLKRGFLKNPLFYFGVSPFILFGLLFSASNSLAQLSYSTNEMAFFNPFFKEDASGASDPFFNQNEALAPETPDLKIVQDNFIYGVSTPRTLTTQTLGTLFGDTVEDGASHQDNEPFEYVVVSGDTVQSVASRFGISQETVVWVNNLSKNSVLKVGQALVILPVSGVIHVVKSGDTISDLTRKYKAKAEEVVAFNGLTNEADIFIGDILVIPGGVMPVKSVPSIVDAPLADNFFIFPVEGKITQGLHFYNAIDIANKCGTPIYAAASGTVQRAKYGWNYGGGNQVTILHSNGVVTYYGHLMSIFAKPGDVVEVGQRIGLMGGGKGMDGAGLSTGCHLHFDVTGGKNPLAKYGSGATINFK